MKSLIIVPTRGRSDKINELLTLANETTSSDTEWLICIDDDDTDTYKDIVDFNGRVETQPRMRLGPWLNYAANKYASSYDALGFMGDDHRPRTPLWDKILGSAIERNGYGVAYGNDLLQGSRLPTAVLISSNIVQAMGQYVPPAQIHMYLDNYWLKLGQSLDALYYYNEVIIEHLHYSNNKSDADELYLEVNSPQMYQHDEFEYNKYVSGQMNSDIARARAALDA